MPAPEPVDIKIGADLIVGQLPRLPLRMLLRRRYQEALGYTSEFDREALAGRSKDDPLPEPSEEPDEYAAGCVLAACVGVCWPTKLDCPSIRECRHDIVAYGEGAFSALVELHGDTAGVGKAVTDAGREILYQMMGINLKKLDEAMEGERVFTEAPTEGSTAE